MEKKEYRVTGEIRGTNGKIDVMTNWLDCPEPEVRGVMIGLEIRGWEETRLETRKEDA